MATHQLVSDNSGVSCHAWNGDRSQLAFAPNSNELRIVDAQSWETVFSIKEHDMLIAAIDWSVCFVIRCLSTRRHRHATTNCIVTVGHDRNAFVWTFDTAEAKWKPNLVILRIERAAMDVKWSPDGSKFAVASSAKCVPVCYYENDNNWWVSKMIKKHKSTVLAVAWHPNSQLVATGSSDFKARVFSATIANVDSKVDTADFATEVPFGDTYCEFSSSGWVHTIAYSPSGTTLAFAGHDSSIHFATFAGGMPVVQTIKFDFLPLLQVGFVSETRLIGCGHDMNPAIFDKDDGWAFLDFVDKFVEKVAEAADTSVKARMSQWQIKDKTGQAAEAADPDDAASWLQHQAPITCMKLYGESKVSTTAIDGRVVVWDV